MIRSARFSEDRSRRFELIRDWRDEIGVPDLTALVVMLNPSKAGEEKDDPTVRKVVGFCRRWGFGRAVVVNLNPIVATDPWALPPWRGLDHENMETIRKWVSIADIIVCAWGSQPGGVCRTIAFPELVHAFLGCAESGKSPLACIGLTQKGQPLHPSRVTYTDRPQTWGTVEEVRR